ncbi:STAS domain-containing protein [Streptomyces montanisoli]|uniref:Anti-sigma factor antagonist n=1 Tax=Streptomyces montanisoli TaxID=2798581 RepID=A0A940MC60_9ACTN|nr:STAS domain-containing protein [Streptomyces montanisoli]MBP0457310.1 STAS domain-containing protein [Streptomyces montanisoli]
MVDNSATVVVDTTDGGDRVVRATGSLDDENAYLLEEALDKADASSPPLVVADLSGLTFADSTVLHVLLRARGRCRASGGRLVIAGPLDGVVGRLFEVTGTREAFSFAETVEAALSR